jgi:hypothetical protein
MAQRVHSLKPIALLRAPSTLVATAKRTLRQKVLGIFKCRMHSFVIAEAVETLPVSMSVLNDRILCHHTRKVFEDAASQPVMQPSGTGVRTHAIAQTTMFLGMSTRHCSFDTTPHKKSIIIILLKNHNRNYY